jgi:hypothetical protein
MINFRRRADATPTVKNFESAHVEFSRVPQWTALLNTAPDNSVSARNKIEAEWNYETQFRTVLETLESVLGANRAAASNDEVQR